MLPSVRTVVNRNYDMGGGRSHDPSSTQSSRQDCGAPISSGRYTGVGITGEICLQRRSSHNLEIANVAKWLKKLVVPAKAWDIWLGLPGWSPNLSSLQYLAVCLVRSRHSNSSVALLCLQRLKLQLAKVIQPCRRLCHLKGLFPHYGQVARNQRADPSLVRPGRSCAHRKHDYLYSR